MRTVILFSISVIVGVITAYSQSWRSQYYPTNWTAPQSKNFYTDAFLQDYSYAGYQHGELAIPRPSGTVFDVSKAPYNADKTGASDATAAIQTAINAAQAAGGGIVYLPAGTYQVNPGSNAYCIKISKSNVCLKGDGVGKTFILNKTYQMNSKKIISVSGASSWTSVPASKALLTADVMNPTAVLPVDNPALFAVGDLVLVRNSITDAWITEHKETDWLGMGSQLGGLMYCRYITAVDVTNKTISIDVPLRYALKTRDAACVFKLSGMISEVGLCDFSIGNIQHPGTIGWGEEDYTVATNAAYDCHNSYAVVFNYSLNSWMKRVETFKYSGNNTGAHLLSNGVSVTYSKNVTIDSCHINHAQYGGGGGNGYAYRVSANEVLICNSMASYVRHGFVFSSMYCSGNVFHNCRDVKNGFQCGNTGSMTTSGWGSDHHMHFSQSNLIDQCYSENSAFVAFYRNYGTDPKHRLTSAHTAFWNITSGGSQGFCVWIQQARYGYAIGSSGTSATLKSSENGAGSSVKTDPVDITEGQGQGATLVPQSLYLDQLSRRMVKPATVSIDSLSIINVTSNSSVAGKSNLPASSSFVLNTLTGTQHNIYASVTGAADSVVFSYNLNGEVGSKKEITAPFALRGDGSGYQAWTITAGKYTVTAKAYSGGIVQATRTAAFTVMQQQVIALQQGWNLISINVSPIDSSIATLFKALDVLEIKDMNTFWHKGQNDMFNGLKSVTAGNGYLVNMNAAAVLHLTGFQNRSGVKQPTTNGWQLIGCTYQLATPFSQDYDATNCSVIKNFEGFWKPAAANNSILYCEPGKAYFIMK